MNTPYNTTELALKYGSHWYSEKRLFHSRYNHDDLIKTIKKETQYKAETGTIKHKKREPFIQHYYDKYKTPELPFVWMVAEVLSLGTWSMIFANLINRDDQKIICKHFNVSYSVMESWLHCLTYLRNLCAHHSKIWNRSFTLKPIVAKKYVSQLRNNSKFAAYAAILKIFLDVISPHSEWSSHLYKLIKQYPCIDIKKMGLNKNWRSDLFWK